MTKKDLIKKILELGKELEKADGFDAIMIVNDMEIEVDNYIKQLPIQNVVQQSEQLKAFVDWWHGLSQEELAWYEGRYVEVFLSL